MLVNAVYFYHLFYLRNFSFEFCHLLITQNMYHYIALPKKNAAILFLQCSIRVGPQPEILACRSVGCSKWSETRKHHTAHINTGVLYLHAYVKHALSCMHASILARWRDCIATTSATAPACKPIIRELRTCYICMSTCVLELCSHCCEASAGVTGCVLLRASLSEYCQKFNATLIGLYRFVRSIGLCNWWFSQIAIACVHLH